jgi:hypothetical protein
MTLYLIVPEVINLTSVIKRYSPSCRDRTCLSDSNHFTYCYLSLYICFFPLESDRHVRSRQLGEYLLITEVKFITSGTIRYNVIKTSY